ncbi:MAG TPA: TlpA disulfide reductase family protein [Gemmatimonadaceae bacterium]|nr:TlpA disulfide reductase family protein [Gemmatimonadaceae bacterium]
MRVSRELGIAGIALLFACAAPPDGDSSSVEIGKQAPAYSAQSLAGDSVSLAAARGKVVLLNVWATWCHPCRDEIPELQRLHEQYRARGLELIGVSVDAAGNDESIRAFAQEFRMTYPIWRDPDDHISTRFLIYGVPATFLVDRDGVLRWRRMGPIAAGDTSLANIIERSLGS